MASSTSTLLLDTYYYLSRTHCSDNADAPLYSNHFLSLSGQELVAHIIVNEAKIRNIFGKDKFLILYTFIIKPLRLVWSASLYKTQPQSKRRASASKFDTIALCGTRCVIISIQANYECL